MRYFAIAIAASLAVFTALSMAWAPQFVGTYLTSVGSIGIAPFDVVLGPAVLALVALNAFFFKRDPVPMNRLVVWLCIALIGYQIFVVLPAAVLLHDLRPLDVLRSLEVRCFGLILVLAVYGVVLRFCKPALLVALFDVAAAALAAWVIYGYLTTGGWGYWQDGVYRLRVAWGGCSLLFGWLLISSLFYWPVRPWRMVLAIVAMTALILTNHRSAFVALLAAFVVQMVATGRITRRVALTIAVVAVMGVGLYYASPRVRDSVVYSFGTMFNANADSTAEDRVERSRLAFDYFLEHPLGDYIWNQRYYLVNVSFDFVPHNFIVQRLVTQGIIASLLFFAIVALSALIAWRNRRDETSAVCLSYLTFYLVFSLFNAEIDLLETQALFAVAIAIILHQNRVLEDDDASLPQLGAVHVSPVRRQ